ncbi:MAG TPA: HAD-IB family hydrolase [Steroidobacteraceae bacterium]|jgi:HAD superfamily hydrolase (TIGR01490 family)|nr:HAD-IB family hydrolase [Steroidobacteraceae bacterium]
MRLVVFDLDGTITRRDTLLPYVSGFLARARRSRWRMLRVLPTLAAFVFGLADHGAVKAAFIRGTLGGATREQLAAWTDEFVPRLLNQGCDPGALLAVRSHREAGDLLVLMSASTDLYVPQIGQALGFKQVICTGVAFDGSGRLQGTLTTANRRGAEKVRCFQALLLQHPGLKSVAYGNAGSDLAHLRLADQPRLVNASRRTRARAAALGIAPYATWLTSTSAPATARERT